MSQKSIPSFLQHRTEMTDDDIRLRAPSVFATRAHEGVSSRYSFVPTTDVLTSMRDAGWFVVEAMEQRVRGGKAGYQKHQLKFQQRGVEAVRGEFMPEVSLVNAHDRTATFQPGFALWRFTCSNGMMVNESDVVAEHVRHVGNAPAEVVRVCNGLFDKLPVVCERVDKFRARELTHAERIEFAERALALRFGTVDAAPVGHNEVLRVRRGNDAGCNLWVVLNRIQENFMRGGLKDRLRRDADGKRFAATRAITSLNVGLEFNRDLWAIASEFANN